MKNVKFFTLAGLVLVFTLIGITNAFAVDYYVDPSGTNDGSHGTGPGTDAWQTIQYAVTNVVNPTTATIVIHVSGDTYTLGSNDIFIGRGFTGLTIDGEGAGVTIVQAETTEDTATDRVFYIDLSETATLSNMTIRYGKKVCSASTGGGGIYCYRSNLTLTSCNIEYNRITASGSATYGGGVMVDLGISSYLTIDKCQIRNNRTTGAGQIGYGGGLSVEYATTTITNSTISDNYTTHHYGGIQIKYGDITITNSTISSNQAVLTVGGIGMFGDVTNPVVAILTNVTVAENTDGDALYADGIQINGSEYETLYIKNCLVANNGSQDFSKGSSSTVNDNGYNIVENSMDYTFEATGDITGSQANLWGTGISTTPSLADNATLYGTQTLALSKGSVAIDAGNWTDNGSVSIPTEDQRGYTRDPDPGTPDIGAYEYEGDTANAPFFGCNF